jgi:hypothetical protein
MQLQNLLKFTETLVLRCWWIILFTLFCAVFYEKGRKKIDIEYDKLYTQLTKLEFLKKEKLEHMEDLLLKVNSQSDPDFVELLLMKELGVVPEGHLKIYFSD